MGSIGCWMSPSARMTAASGIAQQLATWPFCARSPLTSWGGTDHPGSACGRGASRPPGTMITCSLFWMDDFMRRPWGKKDQPQLAAALDYVRSGDTLVVWRLDRLARSLHQLIQTVEDLEHRGIALKSLTEAIDTGTPGDRLVFHIFGSIA